VVEDIVSEYGGNGVSGRVSVQNFKGKMEKGGKEKGLVLGKRYRV